MLLNHIKTSLLHITKNNPLILCLTNYVTIDFVANGLLALGAAPLMSESTEELEELINISQALYLNIGTLNEAFMARAVLAAQIATALHKPIILDPVGSGASKARTTAAMTLLPFSSVIRGNASEIISLNHNQSVSKGVETVHPVEHAINTANELAIKHNKVLIISGPNDFVTNGNQQQSLSFGSPLMPRITGMGCTLTAVLSAFVASNQNHFQAALQATAFFGLCGQLAQQQSNGPGSFKQAFINNLYHPDWDFFASCEHAL